MNAKPRSAQRRPGLAFAATLAVGALLGWCAARYNSNPADCSGADNEDQSIPIPEALRAAARVQGSQAGAAQLGSILQARPEAPLAAPLGTRADPHCQSDGRLDCLRAAGAYECLLPRSKYYLQTIPGSDLKIYSQNGEDGILLTILQALGVTNRFYVEFGTEDGSECNTRVLRELFGWEGLLMDGGHQDASLNLHKEFITAGNINKLFRKYKVPHEFDVLSIDLDYDDYFVWKALDRRYRPRVVMVEYNGAIPANVSCTADPADKSRMTGTSYNGCSQRALFDLAPTLGYDMVAANRHGVNAFFIRTDILRCQGVQPPPFEELWQPKSVPWEKPELDTARKWIFLDEDGKETKREYQLFV